MTSTTAVETRQDSGRLVAFSDGVVAIAITLLILPLADITLPSENPEAQANPLMFVWQENQSLITSFLVSWFVILVFWLAHHRLFGEIERINTNIIKWNVLWLFGIIILPFPMNLLDQVGPASSERVAAQQTTIFYLGTMFAISLMMSLMGREIRRDPSLLSEVGRANLNTRTLHGWFVTWYMALLLPLAWFAPNVAMWGLVGLLAIGPVGDFIDSVVFSDSKKGNKASPPSASAE